MENTVFAAIAVCAWIISVVVYAVNRPKYWSVKTLSLGLIGGLHLLRYAWVSEFKSRYKELEEPIVLHVFIVTFLESMRTTQNVTADVYFPCVVILLAAAYNHGVVWDIGVVTSIAAILRSVVDHRALEYAELGLCAISLVRNAVVQKMDTTSYALALLVVVCHERFVPPQSLFRRAAGVETEPVPTFHIKDEWKALLIQQVVEAPQLLQAPPVSQLLKDEPAPDPTQTGTQERVAGGDSGRDAENDARCET